MPLCIYNIKKSLSIIYTEEKPSRGGSPRQFDDVGKKSREQTLTKLGAARVPPFQLHSLGTCGRSSRPDPRQLKKGNRTMKLTKEQINEKPHSEVTAKEKLEVGEV